ncbi:glycoside hydrolase family 57 protein [Thiofilum flexile]|uniref:glycoside hydrolase family 57 protein n=1 Tax=Thiofilum flexile TaxID=125627 RepID=UPI000371775C|nr:glycoside hydrolase family 57 protein [Thiofilum flexile]
MSSQLNVVLCWHMHQPWYRDGLQGPYRLPWVYLHAIKDYSDMAAHLERYPAMHAVVNFAPVLLEQLDDYAEQLQQFLKHGTPLQDRFLNLLAGIEPIPTDEEGRATLLAECQRCYAPRMIDPYPAFASLLKWTRAQAESEANVCSVPLHYLGEQYFIDILVWYHLVWFGYSERHHALVQELMAQKNQFTLVQRRELLKLMQTCIQGLIPRYKALADSKQIELSMTPYMHPIVPLLNDFKNMRDALPDAPAPDADHYPQGVERSRWHLEQGIAVFKHYFGRKPAGVWLSEGGVSEDALALLDELNIRWTASGEGVWGKSCEVSGITGEDVSSKRALFQSYQQVDHRVKLFFRDDGLSDLIGFKYSNMDAHEATQEFVGHLKNIAAFLGSSASKQVVSIILDGENAWEFYPDNGHFFLDSLYQTLTTTPEIKVTTFNAVSSLPARPLARLSAGSWVYGSFSTWIGSTDKNRAWDYLVAAKQAYDQALLKGALSSERFAQASQQLAVCEGSDWFWWFGDYNPSNSVSDFETLFRRQLKALYHLLDQTPPAYLDLPLSQGGGNAENAGTMRRNVD